MSDASTSARPVCIAGTGSYLPEQVLTNADLEKRVDTTDEWIVTRTGIRERRIAAEDEYTSHLATHAARKALGQAQVDPADLQLIIVATITPDTLTPSTACYVQQNLGAFGAVAFDISAACSGFLYAMKIAKRLISDGAFDNALIIGAEKLSSFVNWEDRSTCVLFGDGSGAAVLKLRKNDDDGEILATEMGTDGRQTRLLRIPGGGSACPITIDNADKHLATLAMLGKEVFKHAVLRMKQSAELVIERSDLTAADIDLVVPHQANLRIIDAIAERLDVPGDRVFTNLQKYGNTSAAAVAIALDEANRSGRIPKGGHVVLVAFGAGLTWAAAAIRW